MRFDLIIEKYTDFIIKFRWLIIVMVPLTTIIVIVMGFKNLGIEGGYRIWFGEGSRVLKEYDLFKATFGTDEAVLITFTDKNSIFNKKALKTIERITKKLWQTKFISRVDSITNYQYIHTGKDGFDNILVENFIKNIDEISEEDLRTKEKIATTDVLTRNLTISPDGKTATIVAKLIPLSDEGEDIYFEIREFIENIIKEESKKTDYKFYLNGTPIINTEFINIARYEMSLFLPLVAIMIFVLLIVAFRKISGALLPLLTVFFTFLLVIGTQAMIGYKLNNFTVNIPVFAMAIGIADTVHLYWVWLFERKHGKDNHEAIRISLKKNSLPVFITSLTTFIGFISLSYSKVIPVRTLGIAMGGAAILALLLSVSLLPALLAAFTNIKFKREHIIHDMDREHSPHFAKKYSFFIINHNKKILIIASALSIFFAIGLFMVRVDSSKVKYFSEDTMIRKNVKFIEDRITGSDIFEIVVDSKKVGGIKDPEFLKAVDSFYADYKEKFESLRHLFSLVDVIKRLNKVMNGGDEAFDKLPEHKNLVAQYLLLYSLSLPHGMDINDRMDVTEKFFRITANVNIGNSSENMQMIKWIEDWWKNATYSAMVTGHSAMFIYLNNDVTNTLIQSITIALTLVTIVMLITFRSFKVMIFTLIPNIIPLVLTIGLMGWLGIFIELGVAVSCAVIIGVAVDDTIHMLVKFIDARKRGKTVSEALESMITFSGVAIFITTVILSMGFSVFIFSDFNPNKYFGIITTLALLIALVADLLVLPAMFSLIDKKR